MSASASMNINNICGKLIGYDFLSATNYYENLLSEETKKGIRKKGIGTDAIPNWQTLLSKNPKLQEAVAYYSAKLNKNYNSEDLMAVFREVSSDSTLNEKEKSALKDKLIVIDYLRYTNFLDLTIKMRGSGEFGNMAQQLTVEEKKEYEKYKAKLTLPDSAGDLVSVLCEIDKSQQFCPAISVEKPILAESGARNVLVSLKGANLPGYGKITDFFDLHCRSMGGCSTTGLKIVDGSLKITENEIVFRLDIGKDIQGKYSFSIGTAIAMDFLEIIPAKPMPSPPPPLPPPLPPPPPPVKPPEKPKKEEPVPEEVIERSRGYEDANGQINPKEWQIAVNTGYGSEVKNPSIERLMPWDFSARLAFSPELVGPMGAFSGNIAPTSGKDSFPGEGGGQLSLTIIPQGEYSLNYQTDAQKYLFGIGVEGRFGGPAGVLEKNGSGFFASLKLAYLSEKEKYGAISLFAPAENHEDFGAEIGLNIKYRRHFLLSASIGGGVDTGEGYDLLPAGMPPKFFHNNFLGWKSSLALNISDRIYFNVDFGGYSRHICYKCTVGDKGFSGNNENIGNQKTPDYHEVNFDGMSVSSSLGIRKKGNYSFDVFGRYQERGFSDDLLEKGLTLGVDGGLEGSRLSFIYDKWDPTVEYATVKGYSLLWTSKTGLFQIRGSVFSEHNASNYYQLGLGLDFAKVLFAAPSDYIVPKYWRF